jgi:hypothetical protein
MKQVRCLIDPIRPRLVAMSRQEVQMVSAVEIVAGSRIQYRAIRHLEHVRVTATASMCSASYCRRILTTGLICV